MPLGDSGGTTVRRIELDDVAAAELRKRSGYTGKRYTKAAANDAANALLRELAAHPVVWIDADIRAALPFLQDARQACWNEDAQRGLDTLIAAIAAAEHAA